MTHAFGRMQVEANNEADCEALIKEKCIYNIVIYLGIRSTNVDSIFIRIFSTQSHAAFSHLYKLKRLSTLSFAQKLAAVPNAIPTVSIRMCGGAARFC